MFGYGFFYLLPSVAEGTLSHDCYARLWSTSVAVSLGVISLLLFFSGSVFFLSIFFWAIQSLVPGSAGYQVPGSTRHKLLLMDESEVGTAKSWPLSHDLCHIYPSTYCKQDKLYAKGFVTVTTFFSIRFSLQYACT